MIKYFIDFINENADYYKSYKKLPFKKYIVTKSRVYYTISEILGFQEYIGGTSKSNRQVVRKVSICSQHFNKPIELNCVPKSHYDEKRIDRMWIEPLLKETVFQSDSFDKCLLYIKKIMEFGRITENKKYFTEEQLRNGMMLVINFICDDVFGGDPELRETMKQSITAYIFELDKNEYTIEDIKTGMNDLWDRELIDDEVIEDDLRREISEYLLSIEMGIKKDTIRDVKKYNL